MPPKDVEDWRIKNLRAKELILSTLVPGSEPWKIAEPLELASDIWKALEARYAPETTEEGRIEDDKRRQAMARATGEFRQSMPNREQRFLWALLHGGKEETNEWFYGVAKK